MRFRLKKLGMFVAMAAVTALFAHLLIVAYAEHHIVVPGRGSHGRGVTLAADPGLFWASVVLLAIFAIFSTLGALMAAWELATGEELV